MSATDIMPDLQCDPWLASESLDNPLSMLPTQTDSAKLRGDHRGHRQTRESHNSAAISSKASEWPNDPQSDLDWNDVGLWTPNSMAGPDMSFRMAGQTSVLDRLDPETMSALTGKTTSADWDSHSDIDGRNGHMDIADDSSSQQRPTRNRAPGDFDGMKNLQQPSRGITQASESTKTCIQELAELNEALLQDKTSNNATRQTDMDSKSYASLSKVSKGSITPMAFSTPQHSIGRTMRHCQDFLNILQRLRSSDSDSAGLAVSEWSYSDEDANTEDQLRPSSAAESHPKEGISTRGRSQSFNNSPTAYSLTPSYKSANCAVSSSSLEIPTLLSILSCYAYILQAYDNVFSHILESITQSAPKIPATLTKLRLDGFELDGHDALQMECLIHVSSNLLEKIENMLIGSSEGKSFGQSKGLLSDKLSAVLLDALYNQNDFGNVNGNGRREVRAKNLIRDIQAALKLIDQ